MKKQDLPLSKCFTGCSLALGCIIRIRFATSASASEGSPFGNHDARDLSRSLRSSFQHRLQPDAALATGRVGVGVGTLSNLRATAARIATCRNFLRRVPNRPRNGS